MASVQRFEELEVWKGARALARKIYLATDEGRFARDFSFRDQLRRSAISIVSNIAEGFERGGNKEFVHFLYIAKGSAGELRAQLLVASDLGYIGAEIAAEVIGAAEALSRQLSAFIKYLAQPRSRST